MREDILKNQPSEYRSMPFWAWNGNLKKERLLEEIEAFQKMGFGGFFMHTRVGLKLPYLGERFMEAVRFCEKEAKKRGMVACLYDEDRYPSGHCGGKVTENPAFMGRQLSLFFSPLDDAESEEEAVQNKKPYLVGRYDIDFAEDRTMHTYKRLSEGERAEKTETWIYSTLLPQSGWFNDANHPDVLNPEVTEAFIASTYERYKNAVGDAFGDSIPFIFTDEPNIGHMGWFDVATRDEYTMFWSRCMPALFSEKYEQNLIDMLPEVFFNFADIEKYDVRYNFLDLVAEQFKNSFSDRIGTWCEENHIRFTGHFHSENTLGGQTCTSVDITRQYAPFHVPGVDMLFQGVELNTAKQASSVAHQLGRETCMTELYGAARWDTDFRRYKMQTDWQTALGFTLRVPHLAFYTMEGETKRDYPACIGCQSPWYEEFSVLENHFARSAAAMREGKPVVKIGVIHPIESYWIGFGADKKAERRRNRIETLFGNITENLLRNHLDFDFISEALLPSMWNGRKALGEMQYNAVVIPGCVTLRSTTLAMLEKFAELDGKVIFVGACPALLDGKPSERIRSLYEKSICVYDGNTELIDALESERVVDIRRNINYFNYEGTAAKEYLYGLREDEEGGWLMIAAASPKEEYDITALEKLHIKIKGKHKVCLYNTLEAKREGLDFKFENGYTVIEKEVYPLESLLIRLGETAEKIEKPLCRKQISLGNRAAYTLSEDNVLVLDMAEYALDAGTWHSKEDIFIIGDKVCAAVGWMPNRGRYTQPYINRNEGRHTIKLRYRFESDEALVAKLGIEFLEETKVYLNGAEIEKETEGYYIDPSIACLTNVKIQKGENVLEIEMPFTWYIQPQVLYVLGDFGVRVCGAHARITKKEEMLYVGDVTTQGLPFYGGNITYTFMVESEACKARVACNYFRAAALKVAVDGKECGMIFAPPYESPVFSLAEGRHTISITALGTRENTLAPLHAVQQKGWYAYWQYRPAEQGHTDGYAMPKLGILKSPMLLQCE